MLAMVSNKYLMRNVIFKVCMEILMYNVEFANTFYENETEDFGFPSYDIYITNCGDNTNFEFHNNFIKYFCDYVKRRINFTRLFDRHLASVFTILFKFK